MGDRNHEKPPSGLGWRYGQQFSDPSVVNAYRFRRSYPSFIRSLIRECAPVDATRVVEIGCGTGDLTVHLAQVFTQIDAVEPSTLALKVAGSRVPNSVRFHSSRFEDWQPLAEYDVAIAGEAFHWLDWERAHARLVQSLRQPQRLITVVRHESTKGALEGAIREEIPHYSTNNEYQRYTLEEELEREGRFALLDSRDTLAVEVKQSFAGFIECFHSRNGFSRDRMEPEAARKFDEVILNLLQRYCKDGNVTLHVRARVHVFAVLPMP